MKPFLEDTPMLETLVTATLLSFVMTVMYKFMLLWMAHELGGARPAVNPSSLVFKNGKKL
jgi:hypothetical protein